MCVTDHTCVIVLCISPYLAKGTTKQDGAGIVTLLSKKSKQLGHAIGQGEDPTIVIECDTGFVEYTHL